jgi:hypothetical protein
MRAGAPPLVQGLPPATWSVALPHERDARAHIETSPILPQALFCLWVRRTPRLYPIAQIMISLRLYALILVAGAVLTVAYFLLRRKPKTAEDLERERRAWLDRIGRITDGTVIDVQEMLGTRERPSTFLIYQYDVAGVSYEASQDVTYLRQLINLHSCRLGLPTSVRYDPHNPGNSIVLSERWMGLRQ